MTQNIDSLVSRNQNKHGKALNETLRILMNYERTLESFVLSSGLHFSSELFLRL